MASLSWPNRITVSRIILIAPFVICLLHLQDAAWATAARRGALAIFVLMAITDALDGYVARRLNHETPLGKFLDPLADKLLVIAAVLLLAREGTNVSGYVLPATVVVVALGKDLCVLIGFAIIYIHTGRTCIVPRRLGKLCTTAQLTMLTAVLLAPDLPAILGWLPRALWWLATAMAVAATVDYYRFGQRFMATSLETKNSQ